VTIIGTVGQLIDAGRVNDIKKCADFAGKRLAITGEGSGSAALTRACIAQNCPGTEMEIVLISGSSNRAVALLAGEVDLIPLELPDAQRITPEAPLSGEGVTLAGSDMMRVLEQVLPTKFGGNALNYQLEEVEDGQGFIRFNLLISPRVPLADEQAVIAEMM
jgi:NMT1/THI5 like